MPRYSVVLLDADNTLFDFNLAEQKALRLTLEAHGIPCTAAVEETYVTVNRELWVAFDRGEITQKALVVERFDRTLALLGRAGDADSLSRCYLTRLGEQSDLLPGAEAFCAAMAPYCTLALVTNGVASVQRGRLDRSPLGRFFPHPYISEELGAQKPERAFFENVFRDMGLVDRHSVLMVGDTLGSDILGGIRAGVDTVWFRPMDRSVLSDIVPTYVADSFPVLQEIVLGEREYEGGF